VIALIYGVEKAMNKEETKAIIEALIFASEVPLTIDKIKEILKLPKGEIQTLLDELFSEYNSTLRGFYLRKVANGYQFRTRSEYSIWIQRLKKVKALRLSQPMMESLAIIAYRQPITRVEIEYIRGVDSEGIIKSLLDKGLINILGRKDVPGRPFLFGTTPKFLEVFGLESLKNLPPIEDIGQLKEGELTLFSVNQEKVGGSGE
jgi:segregation and condensation protein B